MMLNPLAQAQSVQNCNDCSETEYRFEFFAGGGYPVRKTFLIGFPQAVSPIEGKQIFSWGGQGGVRFGIDGRRYWGQDYAYSYGQNATRLETDFGSFSFTNRVHQASTSVLFYPWSLERRVFFPYATAGVGATWVTVSRRTITESLNPFQAGFGPLESKVFAAFHAGVGTRIRFNERFGLRVDARDYMSSPLRYGLPKSSKNPNTVVLPVSGACWGAGLPSLRHAVEFAILQRVHLERTQDRALEIDQVAAGAQARLCGSEVFAIGKLNEAGLPYIVVLCDPTTAGVHASYASTGDVIIAEPGALVGFAGERVAQQAGVINRPPNFQRAEFQLDHGMVDMVVARRDMKQTLVKLLNFCSKEDADVA
jgi:hypothetical protein